jgi:predicted membrane protein
MADWYSLAVYSNKKIHTMQTTEYTTENRDKKYQRKQRGRVLGGLVIVAAGAVLFAHKAGAVLPEWLFAWPMIIIAIGIYSGARRSFRDFQWLIPVAIGGLFMADRFIEGFSLGHYIWPIIVIAIGLSMMLRPKRKHDCI